MIKLFNNIFNIMKIVLLLVAFIMILYILMYTFYYTGKNAFGSDILEFFGTLLPFILVLMSFIVSFVLRHSVVNNNTLFNAACVVALLSIVFIGSRTLFDQNMIFWAKDGFNINFHYFADQIIQIKLLLYFIFVTNILLIFSKKKNISE